MIYPLEIRDLLLWFAHFRLYTPKWTEDIHAEWDSVMERKGISLEERQRRIAKMNQAFPFALVDNYSPLIETLNLPDPKDRHVLAAAIKVNAN